MSAHAIFDRAPLGSLIRYSDGTSQPPERHSKKLANWRRRNSGGRLIRKQDARSVGSMTLPATITLHKGDFGQGGIVVLTVHETISVDNDLTFTVIEQPAIGAVRILSGPEDDAELLHLAPGMADAETWLQEHRYPDAVLDEVTADHVAADVVEGRAAA
ncbi:hypothetical protein J5289_28540 (plasmid) [Rhizobium sp. B230/85]|uniref:hypothetical protein n=1 Tax=unclassified Rhizobium TaxID=2613769 RepID=UPI001ADD19B2|nr:MULTISPECIES: hypothetical protein [unclassified Rhizobium]MBO9136641.1 hypothetical protein [Rhizobium sp. B209b/85]QXZ99769.1 hypothetical protein J5289_28540 [Rhizobium sp. B230/85]